MTKNREPSFSLNDFKKWMDGQNDDRKESIGTKVESKINLKKLVDRIEPAEGEITQLAKDFKRNGGTIAQMDGQAFLIEVNSGSFVISRLYVRKVY